RSLAESMLVPLGPGGSRRYRPKVFDYLTDAGVQTPTRIAEVNSVVLFDGVFLLRPELAEYWDFSIFVEASFENTMVRAQQRDAALFGGGEEVRRRYEQRYIPGQRLYFAEGRPRELAKVVIDNNDPWNPDIR